jgi:selenocysteine-specific elongation factor
MDLAMLVVAADDSVKPQTREHLEILRLLRLKAGVIVLTKCDLADPDWIELVEDEIRELVADTFLAGAPIVRTSVETGQGLDDLRHALAEAARTADRQRLPRIEGPFRMPIDRSFTIAGHGTVVTGSVSSGRARLADTLVIEPGGIEVRVRGLHNHDRIVEEVHRGQRAAINLAGVHHDEICRGQELASAGHLRPSRLLTVQLGLLESAPAPLKNRARVRVHVGTAELIASVRLLDREQLGKGETAPAQLYLSEPAATVWSQPFVIRRQSPVVTVGGGQVLDPDAEKIRNATDELLQYLVDLSSSDTISRASAALYFAGLRPWTPEDLARTAGVERTDETCQVLRQRGDLKEIRLSPTRTLRIHRRVIDRLCDRIEAVLERLHQQQPLLSTIDRSQLASRFRYLDDEALIGAVLQDMHAAGRIRLAEKRVALVGQGPKLSQNEHKLLAELIERFRQAGLQPPSVKECREQAKKNQESVSQLIALAAAEGDLVEIAADFYLHADVEREARQRLAEELAGSDGMTLSQIREALGTTRKYAVPLCEYFDRIGFTRRQGDLRVLAQPAPTSVNAEAARQ